MLSAKQINPDFSVLENIKSGCHSECLSFYGLYEKIKLYMFDYTVNRRDIITVDHFKHLGDSRGESSVRLVSAQHIFK